MEGVAEDLEVYVDSSNQTDEVGNRQVANNACYGRFHSDWLNIIYSRLKLAWSLLSPGGAIVISIDDHEVHNLRRVCDEVFGDSNFVADIAWQKRYTRSNNTVDFTTVVEHILLYRRSPEFCVNLLPRTDDVDARYTNPDNDPRGPWKGASFLNPATPQERPNLCYPIQNPNTREVTHPTTNAWRRSRDEFERLARESKLYWGLDGRSSVPSIKMFLSEARGLTPINFWSHDYAGNTDQGTQDLESLMGGKYFNNPKPVLLIKRILEHASGPNDLILDFFAGSGTTAQAVLEKNLEDGGNRQFILVQLPEASDVTSAELTAGYGVISDLTKERIRRVGQKICTESALTSGKPDVGFRVLKIDTSNMKEVYYTADVVRQADLLEHTDNIKEDRTPEDLLFQVLVDWGVNLALPISKETIAGKTVFFVDDNAVAACFDPNISEDLVQQLAKRKPMRAVFRDNSYGSDSLKINVGQIVKLLAPGTEVRSI